MTECRGLSPAREVAGEGPSPGKGRPVPLAAQQGPGAHTDGVQTDGWDRLPGLDFVDNGPNGERNGTGKGDSPIGGLWESGEELATGAGLMWGQTRMPLRVSRGVWQTRQMGRGRAASRATRGWFLLSSLIAVARTHSERTAAEAATLGMQFLWS